LGQLFGGNNQQPDLGNNQVLFHRTPGGQPISKDTTGLPDQVAKDNVYYHPENHSKLGDTERAYQQSLPNTKENNGVAIDFLNPNRRGNDFIKFDAWDIAKNTDKREVTRLVDGKLETTVPEQITRLIDGKMKVTTQSDQAADLLRMSEALRQNPQVRGAIAVPDRARADSADRILRQLGITNIEVIVHPFPKTK
jgi:hypothetical protein